MSKKNTRGEHAELTNKFVALANQMKNEGYSIEIVSAAMMSASCVYTTYSVAGNEGILTPKGIDAIADKYKETLSFVQTSKKAELEAKSDKA